ncbi:MAG: glycerol-3-phosphate acyltransferase, partial [Alphaproteobacteria bacterium]|nr:glycerol-3-phosphate acyltransferase [Alphaproteobacteria bacterium]
GLLLVKFSGRGDIRNVSSGNIGATNVARVMGLSGFVITWALDMAKVILPVLIGGWFYGAAFGALCGAFSIVGHMFPIWLRGFKGGKGVSTLFGYMLALNPIVFITQGLIWLIVGLSTGYSSLAAWVNWLLLPVFGFALNFWTGVVCIPLAVLGLWAQRENIKRFMNGNESKMQMSMGKMAIALVAVGLLAVGLVLIVTYL